MKFDIFIELTTGDIITPKEMRYKYKSIFDDKSINIMAYTLETVLAEKFETLIDRGTDNTRMKDYYDLFVLTNYNKENFDNTLLVKAFKNTFEKRETNFNIENINAVCGSVKENENLKQLWVKYQTKMPYAKDIKYEDVMDSVSYLVSIIEKEMMVV
jgi:predicted nucleotidyltransferase component of viral defense system